MRSKDGQYEFVDSCLCMEILAVCSDYLHVAFFSCADSTLVSFCTQIGQLRSRLAAKAKAQDYGNGTLTALSGNVNDILDKPSPLLSLVLAASDDVTALRKATAAATSEAPAPGENKGGDDHEAALALDSAGLAAAASRMEELQVCRFFFRG